MKSRLLPLICVTFLALSLSGFGRYVEVPPEKPVPVKKDKAQRYTESAENLRKDADSLEARIPKLPELQKKAAIDLVAAKRRLADVKIEAAELWKKHLGDLPEEFKPKLREAQSSHASLSREFYRIGREIKEAKKTASPQPPQIAPASVLGK